MDIAKPSNFLNALTLSPVDLSRSFLISDGVVVESLQDSDAGRCFLSFDVCTKYFSCKKLKSANLIVLSATGYTCVNEGNVKLLVQIRSLKVAWTFFVVEGLTAQCIIGMDFMHSKAIKLDFPHKVLSIHRDIDVQKLIEFPHLDINLADSLLSVENEFSLWNL